MSLGWSPNPGGPVYMSSEEETPEMTLPSSLCVCRHSMNTAVCQTRSHMLSRQTPISSHPEHLGRTPRNALVASLSSPRLP